MTADEFAALIAAERAPRFSNCLCWAGHMLRKHGGYGLFRHGHNGVPFHALWSPDHVNVASYEPKGGKHWKFADTLHGDLLVLFRGEIVIGDEWPYEVRP